MLYTSAHKKYRSIKERSFKTFLDLFLICTFINDNTLESATESNFSSFDYDDPRIPKALKAYQIAKDSDDLKISELDKSITEWLKSNDVNPFKTIFFRDKIISDSNFKAFYKDDGFDRECEYCKIKESEIDLLIKRGEIHTKRLGTRGRTMEVDQRNPNKGYISGNIAICCYWCNNAKTDEFSIEEFRPIAKLIGQTLKNRLAK